jgi:hypothetical protein
MTRVPLHSKSIIITTGIVATSVQESQVKSLGSLVLGEGLVNPQKAVGLIAATAELIRFATPADTAGEAVGSVTSVDPWIGCPPKPPSAPSLPGVHQSPHGGKSPGGVRN